MYTPFVRLCIDEYPTHVCGPDPAYVITQVPYTCQKFAYTRTAQPLLWPKSNLNSVHSSIYSTLCRALYNPATQHHPTLFMCMLPPVSLDKNTPPCAGTTFFLMDTEGVQQAGLGQQGIL